MVILIPLVILGALVVCGPAECAKETLRFDAASANASTVIGLYVGNGMRYHQRVDFTLTSTKGIANPKVLVHAHVGSEIKPEPGKDEAMLGIRVNKGAWHWVSLKPYMNNARHWIEIPIDPSELKSGLNRVETNSTVANRGNLRPGSLDILASRAAKSERSWHTHDFRAYRHMTDRNWEIRIEFDSSEHPYVEPATLRIRPATAQTGLGEPVQFTADARDGSGAPIDRIHIKWSSDKGTVDKYGLFTSHTTGTTRITAAAGKLRAESTCEVVARPPAGVAGPTSDRRLKPRIPHGHLDLNGVWQFRMDPDGVGEKQNWQSKADSNAWSTIHVPGCWQAQGAGLDYHGIAWYKRDLKLPSGWKGKQVWLRFDAVATHAKVWVNGKLAGEHLGNWSPFELRVTDLLANDKPNTILVRVKEMREHFSAGFLPVIAPHFGGIWQSVTAFATGDAHLADVFAKGDPTAGVARIEADIVGAAAGCKLRAVVLDPDGAEVGRVETGIDPRGWQSASTSRLTVPVKNARLWSPSDPALYTARIEIRSGDSVLDSRTLKFGFRTVTTKGAQLLLNGEPIYAQGLLHWGYYPDLISIDPSEDRIRKEFADARAHGFNMIKACLFYMPKRFYEIADETGMLVWQEHPVWQTFPKEDEKADHAPVLREYEEWFRFDRSHPSVILRSMTCEAPSMHKGLTEAIFARGKELTLGELIKDDSGFRLEVGHTDWYDIHTYQEIDTHPILWSQHWKPALAKLPAKPFIVGEDLDYDTYRNVSAIRTALSKDGAQPWWLDRDGGVPLQEETERKLIHQYGAQWPAEMEWRQNRHVLAVRKAETEDYRKAPEYAGHTMTGMRDNLHTRCGFYDDLERPKWSPDELRRFFGDTILMLDSPRQSHCFRFDEQPALKIMISNFGKPITDAKLTWRLLHGEKLIAQGESTVSAPRGEITRISEIKLSAPAQTSPTKCTLMAELDLPGRKIQNDWPVWFFPAANAKSGNVIATETLNAQTRKALIDGATVVFLPKDDDTTLPRRDAPFWREMAIWLPTGHPVLGDFPHDNYVDLQFIGLTQRKPFDTRDFRDDVTPLVWGVNGRYMGGVILVDYIFEARVGKGKLLACCLNTRGDNNIAGQHLLGQMLDYASSDAFNPSGSGDGALRKLLE